MDEAEADSGNHVLAITSAAGGASIMTVPLGDGSEHRQDWESDLRDLEDLRTRIVRRYAPRERQQYLKVDSACHLLSEVLLLQREQDSEV